jgi:polysaccharide export outer membrane protein
VFNLNHIRQGRSPDPEILGGDVVVIGYSAIKGAFRDFLSAAPALAAFRPF